MDIGYKGIENASGDYTAQDGWLEACHGLLNEGGGLRPIGQPASEAGAYPEGNVIYIHKGAGYVHYIIEEAGAVRWEGDGEGGDVGMVDEYNTVISIGNVLIFLTDGGMRYYLWKGIEEGYLYLGDHLPELPKMNFGLIGLHRDYAGFQKTWDLEDPFHILLSDEENYIGIGNEEGLRRFTELVYSMMESFKAEIYAKGAYFLQPFFVRFAYRLYDGTLALHSSPILMLPSTKPYPWVRGMLDREGGEKIERIHMAVNAFMLDYGVIDLQRWKAEIENWRDIIKSVDVFVSAPIDLISRVENEFVEWEKPQADYRPTGACVARSGSSVRYKWSSMPGISGRSESSIIVTIPSRSNAQINDDISSCGNFYFLSSISIDEFKEERTTLNPGAQYMQSLVNREQMTDDYESHDTLAPRFSFAYNNRLNIANIEKFLFSGYDGNSILPYTGPAELKDVESELQGRLNVYVYIKENGRERIVKGPAGYFDISEGRIPPLLYLFYPNPNAYKAVVVTEAMTTGKKYAMEWKLKPHDFLNGAFYFDGIKHPDIYTNSDERAEERYEIETNPTESGKEELKVKRPNYLYTSEVDNPFYFPAEGVNAIGVGEILGICAAARPLSTGQFGQFPLYAFTDEGVWALELTGDGTYRAKQPITREVCINPEGITQLDRSVVFPTDRGLMNIAGSDVVSISDAIFRGHGEGPGNFMDVLSAAHREALGGVPRVLTREILRGCRMLYDYRHQRLIVYMPVGGDSGKGNAFVYSFESRVWGSMDVTLVRSLNSYPEALGVVLEEGGLRTVDFGTEGSEALGAPQWVLTRPMKLGAPDVMKTVREIVQRGHFDRRHVGSVLFGSRDLMHWHVVGSSVNSEIRGLGGSGYKYFKLLLECGMKSGEVLTGMSLRAEARGTAEGRMV